jgi:hypothetical protein
LALKHVGNSRFVDDEPLSLEEIRKAAPLEWVPGLERYSIFPWVEFYSLERAGYGLVAIGEGKPSVSKEVREQQFDPSTIAPLTEFSEAIKALEDGETYLADEFPYVEITEERDYRRAVAACLEIKGSKASPLDWSPRDRQDEKRVKYESKWEGPGVYDVRECPPSKHAASVEEYELDGMEAEASDVLDFMFQGDEWKDSLRELISELLDG